jgi:hypothetical protein
MKILEKSKTFLSSIKELRERSATIKKGEKSQFYFTVIYKDQKLFIGLVKSTVKSYDLIDDLTIDVEQVVVDKQYVRDTESLAKILYDLINLLTIENNLQDDLDIPIILLLDSVNFSIMQYTNKSNFSGLTSVKDSLLKNNKNDIYNLSPYIESDTVFDIFAYEGINNDKMNIQFTSKKHISSWVDTLRKIEKKIAFIGSSNIPILLELMKIEEQEFFLFDVGTSKSKIFYIDKQKSITEYPFPYGYQQFIREGSIDGERLIKQITTRIKDDLLSEKNGNELIYISGLTNSEDPKLNSKRYKWLATLFKKELTRCKKNAKISMPEVNFRIISILTKELL